MHKFIKYLITLIKWGVFLECELCGARNANKRAKIEGVILDVCQECARMGDKVEEVKVVLKTNRPAELPEELNQFLVKDFSRIIKKQREKRKLTQEQIGEKLNIRASLIKRIEDGWEPPFPIVNRLEKYFKIKLIERLEKTNQPRRESKSSGVTIGDIIEIK